MRQKKLFRELLLKWHAEENKRTMPWKGVKDAYKVWLSEIILQQTRVEQGWDYYEKFIQQYPTIVQLANAEDEDVFKLWEGLGYYTRCRNLLHTARVVRDKHKGCFPSDYNTVLNLKGIGSYTAAAITSFCFSQPYAVVDGNVLRVLSRFFGIETPVDATAGKKLFARLAQECLDTANPGEYNQSIMDFGATVCKPLPLCRQCLLQKNCVAFGSSKVDILPIKKKSARKKERWFSYFILTHKNKTFVQQRTAKDIWQNLYEFYLEETSADPAWNKETIKQWLASKQLSLSGEAVIIPAKKQALTHQVINGYFIVAELKKLPPAFAGNWLSSNQIKSKAFPQFIHQFTEKTSLQLRVL
ncbi:A/G-specific adenine glycosylase [Parafilimonas sp.]|uniref:A/G-specific adenine glycosylase n=1 Tax=Parafilimonas sp. TaxID=1969739 RepID=UPI0039E70AFC